MTRLNNGQGLSTQRKLYLSEVFAQGITAELLQQQKLRHYKPRFMKGLTITAKSPLLHLFYLLFGNATERFWPYQLRWSSLPCYLNCLFIAVNPEAHVSVTAEINIISPAYIKRILLAFPFYMFRLEDVYLPIEDSTQLKIVQHPKGKRIIGETKKK